MSNTLKLPKKIKNEFRDFLEDHPPAEFSANLRRMVLDYMRQELKNGTIPPYLNKFLWSLNDLFDLLDTAEKEFIYSS